ncbi:hypothetical protein IMZ48_21175 [Candidatus Bathyarchaeota archaeon]|nr:hypothetical protein [Candidatus Bathyarchaeota archaeon]
MNRNGRRADLFTIDEAISQPLHSLSLPSLLIHVGWRLSFSRGQDKLRKRTEVGTPARFTSPKTVLIRSPKTARGP